MKLFANIQLIGLHIMLTRIEKSSPISYQWNKSLSCIIQHQEYTRDSRAIGLIISKSNMRLFIYRALMPLNSISSRCCKYYTTSILSKSMLYSTYNIGFDIIDVFAFFYCLFGYLLLYHIVFWENQCCIMNFKIDFLTDLKMTYF